MQKLTPEELDELKKDYSNEPPHYDISRLLSHIAFLEAEHQRRMERMQKYKATIRWDAWRVCWVCTRTVDTDLVTLRIDGSWGLFTEHIDAQRFKTASLAFAALDAAMEKLEVENG